MDRLTIVAEEKRLFREYYREADVGKRQECCGKLHHLLAERLRRLGRDKDGLVCEEFLGRQAAILRCLLEGASGDWEADLERLAEKDLDDLVMLCSAVGDDILMAYLTQILERKVKARGYPDHIDPLSLVQDGLMTLLCKPPGRAAMMRAILDPEHGKPVCAGYSVRTVRNGIKDRLRSASRKQEVALEDDAGVETEVIPREDGARHVAKDPVLAEVLSLPGGSQVVQIIRSAWVAIAEKHRPPLWLSERFQEEGMDEVMAGIASPVSPYEAGQGIKGHEAAAILGISRGNLHKKVCEGNRAFCAAVRKIVVNGFQQKGVGR